MKILAIDDNRDNLTTLKAVVADRLPGDRLLTALSGQQGFELAQAEDPDVILLDIVMPGMDGYAVCRKLKEDPCLQLIPVLFLTALKTDRDSRLLAMDAGADGFLSKPVDEVELTVQLRAMAKIKAAAVMRREDHVRLAALVAERTRALQQSQAATLSLLDELKAENAARKESELVLRKSEGHHRSILQAAMDGIWLVDMQGRLLEVNGAYSRMSGYSEQELLAMCVSDLEASESAGKSSAHLQKIMVQGEVRFETRHRRKDGRLLDVEISSQYRPEDGGRMVTFVHDITERKRAEEYREMGLKILHVLNEPGELKEAIKRVLDEVQARAGIDAVGIRLQDGEDFPYFAQKGFSDEFLLTENTLVERGEEGWPCRDNEGEVCLACTCGLVISGKADLTHPLFTRGGSFWTNDSSPLPDLPAELDPRYHPRNVCIFQGYASMALIPVRNKDRIVGLLHLNGLRKGCFTLESVELLEGIAAHIGAALMRKQAEAAVNREQALSKAIIDSIPGAFYMLDEKGGYVRWNAYQRDEIIGLPEDQIFGASALDTIHPEDRVFIQSRIVNVLRNGAVETVEGRVLLRGGPAFRWLLMTGRQMTVEGKPFLVGIGIDITWHKRAEEELQKVDKLQSVGTLAGGIAHDFNNILLGVFGNISLAMDELSIAHPSYAPLEESRRSMSRAVRLTKQLLTFAKGGSPVKEDVGLGALVEEVARFDLSGSPVSLVFRQAEDLWPVQADKGQLQQVISNLVINARQAMPNGGQLTVTLENAELPAEVVPGLCQGRYVKVTVRDEGLGIHPAVLDRIFDPYFTTKQTGSGLGLATAWSIITKHGGHIGVASELGQGTTFTFYLPASSAPLTVEETPPASVECLPPPRAAKILVMDDEDMVSVLVARMLVRCGYAVATAPEGQKAVELYKQALEAGVPFDVVIMDLTIPGGVGGLEAIKRLLALDPSARAIVSSGYADDPVMARFADYGFKGTVAKPYTRGELLDVVARVLS